MIAQFGGIEAIQEEAHRIFVGRLAQRITEALDGMAGPRALSPEEREIQQICRDKFTLYDPASDQQVRYVLRLRVLAMSARPGPAGPHPRPEERPDRGYGSSRSPSAGVAGRRPALRRPPHSAQLRPRRPQRATQDWGGYLSKWRRMSADDDDDPGTTGPDKRTDKRRRLQPVT